jgi:hypothetical protein
VFSGGGDNEAVDDHRRADGSARARRDRPGAEARSAKRPRAEAAADDGRSPRRDRHGDGARQRPAGIYQVRLTAEEAKPDATGTSEKLERWVEFLQKGDVKGREVVSIIPQAEQKLIQKDTPPPAGGSKVQMLKGGEYMRVWINKGGTYYLIHLPV